MTNVAQKYYTYFYLWAKIIKMFGKGSKIYAITTGCCPRCNEESMYKDANPFHLSKIYDMYEKCSHCGLTYSIEPSFFYGAMYVSYALGVAFSIAAFVVSYVFLNLL